MCRLKMFLQEKFKEEVAKEREEMKRSTKFQEEKMPREMKEQIWKEIEAKVNEE